MVEQWGGPVDEGKGAVLGPDEPPLVTLFWWLQHEPHPGIVALALDAIQATSLALEADTFGLAETDLISRLIGAGRQRLGGDGIDVVSNPGTIGTLSEVMQGILRETVVLPELGECRRTVLFMCLWYGTRSLPCRVSPHPVQTRKALTQH